MVPPKFAKRNGEASYRTFRRLVFIPKRRKPSRYGGIRTKRAIAFGKEGVDTTCDLVDLPLAER